MGASKIELSTQTPQAQKRVLDEMARNGLFVATVGDRVQGCGGVGSIVSSPSTVLVDGRPIATVGASYRIDACAHGCPACPHPGVGLIKGGTPAVLANGRPVAVAGSPTAHRGCCGSNKGWVMEGRGSTMGQKVAITETEALRLRPKLSS